VRCSELPPRPQLVLTGCRSHTGYFSGVQCGFKAIRVVADGKIHYFIGGNMMQGETGSDAAARISEWVAANFQAETIGGTTVYDLS
jgi:hypothetical protein